MEKQWYAYSDGDPRDVNNYYILTVPHSCLCGDKICAVYTNQGGLHPIAPFSHNVLKYISDGLSTGQIQPQNPYRSKKYVYLKI